jgi:hypothetical protein
MGLALARGSLAPGSARMALEHAYPGPDRGYPSIGLSRLYVGSMGAGRCRTAFDLSGGWRLRQDSGKVGVRLT